MSSSLPFRGVAVGRARGIIIAEGRRSVEDMMDPKGGNNLIIVVDLQAVVMEGAIPQIREDTAEGEVEAEITVVGEVPLVENKGVATEVGAKEVSVVVEDEDQLWRTESKPFFNVPK